LSFVATTADVTGKDKRSIERAAARGESLGDDLGAVTGTSLDKGVELDALAKLSKDRRKEPKIETNSGSRHGLRRLVSWRREENPSFF